MDFRGPALADSQASELWLLGCGGCPGRDFFRFCTAKWQGLPGLGPFRGCTARWRRARGEECDFQADAAAACVEGTVLAIDVVALLQR